jgi:hypothetical protein
MGRNYFIGNNAGNARGKAHVGTAAPGRPIERNSIVLATNSLGATPWTV